MSFYHSPLMKTQNSHLLGLARLQFKLRFPLSGFYFPLSALLLLAFPSRVSAEIGVVAHNAAGDSAPAFEAFAPTEVTHPAPPSNLVVKRIDAQRLRLTWTGETTTNGFPNAFRIWRAEFDAPWVLVIAELPADLGHTGNQFFYDDAAPLGRYRYAVATVNTLGIGNGSPYSRNLSDAVDTSIAEAGAQFSASLSGLLEPHPHAVFSGTVGWFVPADYDAYSVTPPVPAANPYQFSIDLPDPDPGSIYGISKVIEGIVPKGKAISFSTKLTWAPPPAPAEYTGTLSVSAGNTVQPLPPAVSRNTPPVQLNGSFTIANAEFSSTLRGFDPRSNPKARMIPVNGSASVRLDLEPGEFQSDALLISPGHRITPKSLKVSGNVSARNLNTTDDDMLRATYGTDTLAEVQLAPKGRVSRTVAIVKVYLPGEGGQPRWPPPTDDRSFEPPTQAVLQKIFDETYLDQANVKFTVIRTPDIVVNYDTGTADHVLDYSNASEYNAMLNAVAPPFVQADYYIFFVKRMGSTVGGQLRIWNGGSAPDLPGGGPGRAAFVNFDYNGTICVHEVGHLLGLQHVWENGPDYSLWEIPGKESERLMGYNSGTRMLKKEWDKIHKTLTEH